MIIVSITGPTMKHALAQIDGSSRFADAFEFRLDMIRDVVLPRLFAATRKPIIATCRPKREGGMFVGTEEERLEMLRSACCAGADWVDVELNAGDAFFRAAIEGLRVNVILSQHHFGSGGFKVAALYQRMRTFLADRRAARLDALKFAYIANDASDIHHAFRFLALAQRDGQKAIAIAMGERGEASRILYKKFGGWATFAATEDGESAQHGQLPASHLKQLYRADRLTRATKLFGVLGNPLKQSKGVYLHNPLFHRAKLNAVYCRFEVGALRDFMRFVAPHLSGFSVTIPHKQAVMKYLDVTDPTAKAIGAVNTVLRRGKKLIGTNTDAAGALDAIENVMSVNAQRMLILGAGGAARAIAYEATRRGAHVFVANRTERKAKALAQELHVACVPNASLGQYRFDIIVNATPVGMAPRVNASPLPQSMLKKKVVFDVVYNPPMTKFLRDAKAIGAEIIQGSEMYLNQAARQSKLYTKVEPSVRVMRRLLGF
jgi:3-dehydroquinate dehydratase/shikimate dehydrogenase